MSCEPRDYLERSPIEEYLSQFAKKIVYYFPNPGNAGDSLISAATFQLLEKLKIRYYLPRVDNFNAQGKNIIYGGGNLTSMARFSARAICALHRSAAKLIILPHTIRSIDSILQELGPNTCIICREKESFRYVSNLAKRASVRLMNDMAFGLDVDRLLKGRERPKIISNFINCLTQKIVRRKSTISMASILRFLNMRSIRLRLESV